MSSSFELKYLSSGIATYPPGATFGPRNNRDYEIVWIIQGNVVYNADGQDYPAGPGAMLINKPQVKDFYTWDPHATTRHAYFHFHVDTLPPHWPAQESWPVVTMMPENDIIRPLFRYILAMRPPIYSKNSLNPLRRKLHYKKAPSPSTAATDDLLNRAVEMLMSALILGPLTQISEHDQDYPEPVQRTLHYLSQLIADDPSAKVRLEDLSQIALASPEHLCRLFRQTLGTGPMETLRLMRLDLAVTLLARSNLNMSQIADRCGFASPYHFSRRFRQVYGYPPSELRDRIQRGEVPPLSKLLRNG